jgi:uncharacterized protein YqjF (DUF2071 family)
MHHFWHDLLFLHWEVPVDSLQRLLPHGLTVDTFDGRAYVGLVPFRISGIRHRNLAPIPGFSQFLEINVRTYVHKDGRDPGVWFFSLDAANPFACAAARLWYKLPYFYAKMRQTTAGTTDRDESPITRYRSGRLWPAPIPAYARIDYRATGDAAPSEPGTIAHFFLERYLLYSQKGSRLFIGQVHHKPYLAQGAEIFRIDENLIESANIARPNTAPLVHFCRGVSVEVFSIHPATKELSVTNSGSVGLES